MPRKFESTGGFPPGTGWLAAVIGNNTESIPALRLSLS